MQPGIFAKTFPGSDPEAVLSAAVQAGFAAVQYNMACSGLPPMPDEITPEHIAGVVKARQVSGSTIVACSATYNMIHPDQNVRELGHRRLEVIAAACAATGIDVMTLCTGTRDAEDQWRGHPDNQSKSAWTDLLKSMERATEIAEKHNLTLGVEPELANVVNSANAARTLMNEMQSQRIGIILDPANLFETETLTQQRAIVSDAVAILGDRIIMGHAKDRRPDGSFTTAGQGVLDYDHYLNTLRSTGFDGPLIAHGLDAKEAPTVGRFLEQCLKQGAA
ncbi:MAG: sugar phosphate isomerase/epimerase [Stappiaceae bacterium]